jgi:hypothetical protein
VSGETIEQPREDVTAPVDTPASPPADDLDSLLAEYDAKTAPQLEPDRNVRDEQTGQAADELDRLLAEINGPSEDQKRITELTERNTAYEQERAFNQLRESVIKFADELQETCPNINVRERLELMEGRDQNLRLAFQYSGLSDSDRGLLMAHYQALERQYWKMFAEPDTNPNKQSELRRLDQEGKQLRLMIDGKQIMRDVVRAIRKENADKVPDFTVEDWMATADRELVAQSVRDGHGELNAAEPEPEYGKLSAAEGRRLVKDKYGFDPGWGI